ncbi:MAG TPA: radical SAM protein [Burkholderiales bacterium]|nr:radical SAM protein [Gemmatimonadales bacterium]HXI35910.1 radical SAM protein [Burkholderiales bacterium]
MAGPRSDLLDFVAVDIFGVEFTSVCNLKCVYCDVSAPGYKGRHTAQELLEAARKIAEEKRPAFMNFTGIGELTTIPQWTEVVAPFLALAGPTKGLTTNLQKQLDETELATLVKFDEIAISIDTADAELLREIRRKSELRNITTSIARIRAHAIKTGVRQPSLRFNAVVTDRSAPTLFDLCAFAVACGIDRVMLIGLNDTAFFVEQAIVRHVRHLPEEAFMDFVRQIDRGRELLEAHGKVLTVAADLDAYIRGRLSRQAGGGALQPGQTRLCTQLWSYAVVKEDGRISHCCSNMQSRKSLTQHSFDEIMEDEQLRTWRRQLLEGGELPHECRTCHWAPPGAPAQLSALVERLRAPNLAGRDRFGIIAASLK